MLFFDEGSVRRCACVISKSLCSRIALRTLLRIVVSVLQCWCSGENMFQRTASSFCSFRFVASCGALRTWVHGVNSTFDSRVAQSIDGGVMTCGVAGALIANGHPYLNVHFPEELANVNREGWDE